LAGRAAAFLAPPAADAGDEDAAPPALVVDLAELALFGRDEAAGAAAAAAGGFRREPAEPALPTEEEDSERASDLLGAGSRERLRGCAGLVAAAAAAARLMAA
jgi:hypothetical protein